jgi:hypothetical protein
MPGLDELTELLRVHSGKAALLNLLYASETNCGTFVDNLEQVARAGGRRKLVQDFSVHFHSKVHSLPPLIRNNLATALKTLDNVTAIKKASLPAIFHVLRDFF